MTAEQAARLENLKSILDSLILAREVLLSIEDALADLLEADNPSAPKVRVKRRPAHLKLVMEE